MRDDVIIFILMVTMIVLWLWALRDLAITRFRYVWMRIALLLWIMVFPAIGSIIFFLMKPELKKREILFEPNEPFKKSSKAAVESDQA